MPKSKKGLVESFSWKEIAGGILAAAGFVFGILEYIINLRQVLASTLGSEPLSSIEGAAMGSITTLIALKFYSGLRGKKEEGKRSDSSEKTSKEDEIEELRSRIREELELLKEQITSNLESKSFGVVDYADQAFSILEEKIIQKLPAKTYRQIKGTYDKICALEFQSAPVDMAEKGHREAISSINKTLELLR